VQKHDDLRIPALRRFAAAITVLNLVGRTVLGFEGSWAQLVASVATAYALELALRWVDRRAARQRGLGLPSARALVDFLLPAHITGMAVSMLVYANDRVAPFVFAAAAAIASKAVVRVPTPRGPRHVLNPSNAGIAVTLLIFPWVGIAPPYEFTEKVTGALDWIIPGIIVTVGTLLNGRFTRRLPLIGAWMAGFAAQAFGRHLVLGVPLAACLGPMTGMAFLLFSFYMVSDPGTTPAEPRRQIAFGALVALAYGVLMTAHVVFGLFFALFAVCVGRGALFAVLAYRREQRAGAQPALIERKVA
jgi:hypothetical protein